MMKGTFAVYAIIIAQFPGFAKSNLSDAYIDSSRLGFLGSGEL